MITELLIMLGLSGANNICDMCVEAEKADKWGVYKDKNGELRINPTLRKVYFGHTEDGDEVIYYKKGGIAKNIGIEEAKERELEAIKNGKSFYLRAQMGGSFMHKMGNDEITGERYCKVNENNNVYYVKRFVDLGKPSEDRWYHGSFYMDMNYNLICPTEECIEKDIEIWGKIKNKEHDMIINKFNKNSLENRKRLSANLKTFSIY